MRCHLGAVTKFRSIQFQYKQELISMGAFQPSGYTPIGDPNMRLQQGVAFESGRQL